MLDDDNAATLTRLEKKVYEVSSSQWKSKKE